MKRRKTVSKYHVDNMGRITNTQPQVSESTRQILSLLSFAEMVNGLSDLTNTLTDDESSTIVDTVEGEVVGEYPDSTPDIVDVN